MNSTKLILLVEDDVAVEALALRALEKSGVSSSVVVARDGVEALDYLFARGAHAGRDPAASPHVVLLDLNLPKLDGLEVLRELRSDERTKLLPVVMLTTSVEPDDLERCYRLGVNSYVRKPTDAGEFGETIRSLARYWLTLNHSVK